MSAQNANMHTLKSDKLFNPKYHYEVKAKREGYLQYLSTKAIGLVSFHLGAGRINKESGVDYHAGIYLNTITNECIKPGQTIATLYSSSPIKQEIINDFVSNYKINAKPIKISPIIVKIMKN
jgi:thymidine phosphorylase